MLDEFSHSKIVENLSSVKEKIIGEVTSVFKIREPEVKETPESIDIESLRREMDEKLEKTLAVMLKRLSEQIHTAAVHENELMNIKNVLKDFDVRLKAYSRLPQLTSSEQTKTSQSTEPSSQTSEPDSSDERVTFNLLKEYVQRTIQLYDADKTGKADFASESLGGSILLTKCTDTYIDESRWFTVFNVPITRITASPRVVIQVKPIPFSHYIVSKQIL